VNYGLALNDISDNMYMSCLLIQMCAPPSGDRSQDKLEYQVAPEPGPDPFSPYLFLLSNETETMHFRHYWPKTTFIDDLKAATFEFVGTTVFLLLAFGGTQGSHEVEGSALERTFYIATAFGLSLLVSAWFFFRATGGLFNPDVSLALLLVGAIGPVRFILYCLAQLVGAITAAAVVLALTPGALTYKYVACLSALIV
jgi:hypothetical protein